jgi:hypothetical protein
MPPRDSLDAADRERILKCIFSIPVYMAFWICRNDRILFFTIRFLIEMDLLRMIYGMHTSSDQLSQQLPWLSVYRYNHYKSIIALWV